VPADCLAQGIVEVHPVTAVGLHIARALIGVVVRVGERNGGRAGTRPYRGDGGQPVKEVVLLGRRHAQGATVRKGNLAHEGRIGKVRIGGRVADAVGDALKAGGGVIPEIVGGQGRRLVKGLKRVAAHEGVVAIRDPEAVQWAAGVRFAELLVGLVVNQRRRDTALRDTALAAKAVVGVRDVGRGAVVVGAGLERVLKIAKFHFNVIVQGSRFL